MRKMLLVGMVASAAVAAMPIVSSFALTGGTVDNLVINLQDSCSLDRTTGDGNYNVSINPGGYSKNFASSTFTVTCNTPYIYTLTAQFSDLTSDGETPISYSTYDPTGAESIWTAKKDDNTTAAPSANIANGDLILQTSTANSGSTVTVRYSVGAASNQAAGTYTGKATYTLVSGN